MICFNNVGLTYEDRNVLNEITCELNEPRVGIIGANGSGKSSLLRLINGLTTPTTGTVTVDGLDPTDHGRDVRSRVSFLFSNPDAQIVMPTVGEDIEFSLRRNKISALERHERIAQALALVGLSDYQEHPAHLLSSGQKQLLAMAAIMVTEPDILLCDEPTTLLDRRNTRVLIDIIDALPQQIIMATHDLDLVSQWPRVLVMEHGEIIADSSGHEAVATYKATVDR
ncbi:MAG: ABC transporter ATP-binding protein [Candidatus Nanopelagicales bacterium]